METLKFVIVGHVDHGKSTLIGRLLFETGSLSSDRFEEIERVSSDLERETEFAYLLDHLEEERQQGITIDTTQTFFKTKRRQYVIIDAPGHVEFVKNMVTGASQADAAVLIVDVRDGVGEQTRRHAYILSLLNLNQVIVVLNKMDFVRFEEEPFQRVRRDVEEFLGTINIKPLLCIPICATSGENITKLSEKMGWYKGPTFLEALDVLKVRESLEDRPLIFPVQDVYRVLDKRIAVGRVEAGRIEVGCSIKVLPGGQMTKVGSIERYLEDTNKAYAGQSIGITTKDSVYLARGDVICSPGMEPVLTESFIATIFWMGRGNFRKDERLGIRCATQETTCKIEEIKKRINSSTLEVVEENGEILESLEVGEVIIRTKRPIVIKAFNDVQELGRFVLVQADDVCAGGVII